MAAEQEQAQSTEHFKLGEFQCPCCGLNNISPEVLSKIERIRVLMGIPLRINSGTRCPKHNESIGGAKNSYHLKGEAIDVSMTGMDPDQRHKFIHLMHQEFHGLGLGKTFVHGDIRETPTTVAWVYP